MEPIRCDIPGCADNRYGKCRMEDRRLFCPRRDDVKVTYDNGVNISHNGPTVTACHVSLQFKGRYGQMLADLKGSNRMYYDILQEVLKEGIEKMWFELNARRNEI